MILPSLSLVSFVSLLLLRTALVLADDDPPKKESFSVYHLLAKQANGMAYYEFGVTHNKDESAVWCVGAFDNPHWGEQRIQCGNDNINIRVQQSDGQNPFTGFNILVEWE